MFSRSSRREGFALAVALAAIVIISAIIAGVFFATTQEYRIGRNTTLQTRALTAAEYGLNNTLTSGQWNPNWNTANAGTLATIRYAPGDGSVDTVRVTKLSGENFLVVSEGRVGTIAGAQARHRIGALVTLVVPVINFRGALTTRGQVKVGGSSFLNGNDSTITGWNCPPLGTNMPGLAMPDTDQINYSGCNNGSCIQGSPKVAQDPMAGQDTTYTNFGGIDYPTLAGMASKTYSSGTTLTGLGPSASAGSCNTGDPLNWGDPLHLSLTWAACQTYFPIIHATGDLHISGGYGQGILLVDGNLDVTGGFQFFGVVIVRGSVSTSGTGGHFNGVLMSSDANLQQNTLIGNAVIQYSSCAVQKALAGSASPIMARGRSWVELY